MTPNTDQDFRDYAYAFGYVFQHLISVVSQLEVHMKHYTVDDWTKIELDSIVKEAKATISRIKTARGES